MLHLNCPSSSDSGATNEATDEAEILRGARLDFILRNLIMSFWLFVSQAHSITSCRTRKAEGLHVDMVRPAHCSSVRTKSPVTIKLIAANVDNSRVM
jgi:hypothetical protein